MPDRKKRRNKIITIGAGAIIVIAVFAFLFPKMGDYSQALKQIADMGHWWLAALAGASIANILVYALTARAAIKGLPYKAAFISRQTAFLVSNVIPGGGAVAVGTQYSVLAAYGVPYAPAAAAVAADGVGVYLITLGAPAIAVLAMNWAGHPLGGYAIPAWIAFGIVVASTVVIAITMRSGRGAEHTGEILQRPVNAVFRLIHKTPPDIPASLVAFHDEASSMILARWHWLLASSIAAQFMPMVILGIGLAAMGQVPSPLSPLEVFAAFSVAMMLTMVPITPGGLGTADAALVALLVAMGADPSTALAADLVWRVVWFVPQLIVGIGSFAYLALDKRKSALLDKAGHADNLEETAA